MLKRFFWQFIVCFPAIALVTFAFLFAGDSLTKPRTRASHPPSVANRAQIVESFGKLPLRFEASPEPSKQLIARGAGYAIHLTAGEATLQMRNAGCGMRNEASNSEVKLRLIGAAPNKSPETLDPLPGHSNYFIGNDPHAWRTNVPSYSRVRYRNIYRGVDLVYYGNQQRLEYDFVIAPHTDPHQIVLALDGAETVAIDASGNLLIGVDGYQLRMQKPTTYQEINGRRREIASGYQLLEGTTIRNPQIGFTLGEYDPSLPLVIDPVVNYATYFGGSGTDVGYGIAIDAQGDVYLTGQTSSLNFPLKNAFDGTIEGANDAFITKINAQGTAVVFSTYLGGRNPGDRGWAIAVDKGNNVYVTGETNSLNFPTVNAAQPVFRGGIDGFVTKLSNDGANLIYSTYLGGGFTDISYSIALDRFDNAYVTGRTESANFPVKNALQDKLRGQRDAFVVRYSPDGEMLYSTYLGGDPAAAGGRDEDVGYGIAVDTLQNAYITGYTTSPTFPLVGALQTVFGGVEDAFVAKLNTTGSRLIYSTYLGGTRADDGRAIAVDGLGNAYVSGYTLSQDFPRVEALQPVNGGSGDGFVAKINASGSALLYSTYLGGTGEENSGIISEITPSCAIAVDGLGNAYVTGKTESQNFPLVRAINGTLRGDNDAYVAKIDPAGSELIYSTFLGSTFMGNNGFDERGLGIATDRLGTVYVTGQVLKNDFQTVQPLQTAYGGGLSDAFIAKITTPDIPGISALSAASFTGGMFAPESIIAGFGSNLADGTEVSTTVPLPTTLLGTSVKVKDKTGQERAAPLFFVSPGQVNFQIPPGTMPGKAQITITNAQNNTLSATVLIDNVAPGLFSVNASGQGLAAALALRVKADGTQTFEPTAQLDGLGRWVALPIDLGPESDQVFLILFGTGWRNSTHIVNSSVRIGGTDVPVFYAGSQGSFVGEDQINMRLPRTLAGRGEIPVVVTIDGRISNLVSVNIR